MTILWLDLETRSRCNLLTRGTYNYAADRSTEILIACWALDDGPVRTWHAWRKEPLWAELPAALANKRVQVRAHSAVFERLVLAGAKFPRVPIERFYCTAAQARAQALPGSLEDVGRALTAKLQKDVRGYELIRLLSIPRPVGTFNEDPKLMREFAAYCARDVEVMRNVSKMLPALTEDALADYHVNEHVNDRGIPIDTELCELALKYGDAERAAANDRAVALTEGALNKARGTLLTKWVYDRMPPDVQKLMEVYRGGVKKLTLDRDTRDAIFTVAEEQTGLIDGDVLEVVETAEAAAAASVAKFQRMLHLCNLDGRLRGAFVLDGASGTGRYSSRGAQLHNFPRASNKTPEEVKFQMRKGMTLDGPVLQVLKSMLRPAICPGQGKTIVRGDWVAVEARGLPWLAGTEAAARYLQVFNDPKRDIYLEQAALAGLGENRQAGKVVVLSLGYGGADGALTVMSKGYGVQVENKGAVVRRWRGANRWAPQFWRDLFRSAHGALRAKDEWHNAGRVRFAHSAQGEVPMLLCRLPSGRLLHYPFAAYDVESENISYLKAAWKPKKDAKVWPRARLWGGLASENVTQAACADLLREAVRRCFKQGLPVIAHVHDEIVAESSVKQSKSLAKELKRVMLTIPAWATGFPLAVETDVNPRFRK